MLHASRCQSKDECFFPLHVSLMSWGFRRWTCDCKRQGRTLIPFVGYLQNRGLALGSRAAVSVALHAQALELLSQKTFTRYRARGSTVKSTETLIFAAELAVAAT